MLKCEFGIISSYGCQVENQVIPANERELVFQGLHRVGNGNHDVKIMYFIQCEMPRVPQNINVTFKFIEELIVTHSKLQTITKLDLRQFENLKLLSLSGNDLEDIPGDLFEFTRHIENAHFNDNKIKFIGCKLLDGLQHLKFVDFKGNVNIDCFFDLYEENDDPCRVSFLDLTERFQRNCKPLLDVSDNSRPNQSNLAGECSKNHPQPSLQPQTSSFSQPQTSFHQKIAAFPPYSIFDDVQNFLALGEFKDFTIIVGHREFKVHKFIFAARSETFAELLKSNPDADDLDLQDISVEVFKTILSYIYTDQLPEDTRNVHEVFVAAGRLKIRGLMAIAADLLIDSIDEHQSLNNLFKILCVANKFDHDELRLTAFDVIKEHFPGRRLKEELSRQPEILKRLIEAKVLLESQLEGLEINS